MATTAFESASCTDKVQKDAPEASTRLQADVKVEDQRQVFGAPRAAGAQAVNDREQGLHGGQGIDFAAQDDIYHNIRTADEPVLAPDQFAEAGKRVLTKLDTAHSGEVSKDQLARGLQDPTLKGTESQAVAGLYKGFDKLHNLSGHEGWFGKPTITASDLDTFSSMAKETMTTSAETVTMKAWADQNLKRFSTNGSDHLTKSDVKRALSDPALVDTDRQVLNLVQKHWGEMDSWHNFSGLTSKDFADLDSHVYDSGKAKTVIEVYGACSGVATEAQKAGVCYDLYSDKEPLRSIDPQAVKQGSIGDCYYEAVVASAAKNNPELIRDAIKDNKNGTYTVTFPGAKNEPITVKAPTEAELGLYNHGSQRGTWAAVMEKAYGQYRQNHDGVHSPIPQEGADGGGRPEPVIKLLTGSDAACVPVSGVKCEDMSKQLETAFASKPAKLVTAAVHSDGVFFKTEVTADKFYRQHAYSITGFTPDGKGGGNVTIRNPWGGADDTPSGTIQLPLDKFMKNFGDVSIQK